MGTPNFADSLVLINYYRNNPDWTEQLSLYKVGTEVAPTDPTGVIDVVLGITLVSPTTEGATFLAVNGPQIEERLFTPFLNKYTGELVCVKHYF
jgi:hypothetical protein